MLSRLMYLSPKVDSAITTSSRWLHNGATCKKLLQVISTYPMRMPSANFLDLRREPVHSHRKQFGSPEPKGSAPASKLKEIMKGHTPSVQLQLVEAYRRGIETSTDTQRKTGFVQYLVSLFARVLMISLGAGILFILLRSSDRGFGGGLPKLFDSSVATFAENVDVRFADVQGVGRYFK